jgi:sulfide:quinone oxidoreductase
MAHIVVIGGGIGGLPTVYELRNLLSQKHQITLISDQAKFTFIPSLPWVGLGLKTLDQVQLDLTKILLGKGINFIQAQIRQIEPHKKQVILETEMINYDHLIIATGGSLNMSTIPGLDQGYTDSVCNPVHALKACEYWQKFLENPGPIVVGAVPGASCFGPVYEFAMLVDFCLREKGLRSSVPITVITPEPYCGHLGIGGMANSQKLIEQLLRERNINFYANTAITEIKADEIICSDGQNFPFKYSMILPSFQGAEFIKNTPNLGDQKGFLPIKPTYEHSLYDSIYGVGVTTQLAVPEKTPIGIGVPKTGQMTEAMGMAVAHNIAVKLGEINSNFVTPTLQAICLTDFGDTGVVFIADPVLPNPLTGKRDRAVVLEGKWISLCKTLFEIFFLAKMRLGFAVPWFEKVGLKMLGLKLVEPVIKKYNNSQLGCSENL